MSISPYKANPGLLKKITPELKIKTSKFLAPKMFENKSSRAQVDLLLFLEDPAKFKAICMFRGGGKTTIVNKMNMFCEIFYNHEPYTQIFSATKDKAEKFLADLKQMVVAAMRAGLNIKKGAIWNNSSFEVIVDDLHRCYVEVYGAGQDPRGGTYDFSRPTLLIFDDIESKQGLYAVASKANRKKLASWFWGECIPGLDPIRGRVLFVGTILHEDSLLNNILKNERFKVKVIPIITAAGRSAWPDRHPLSKADAELKRLEFLKRFNKESDIESIEEIKERYKAEGQLKLFYQEYLCVPQAEEARLFKAEYFRYYSHIECKEEFEHLEIKTLNGVKKLTYQVPTHIVLSDGEKIDIEHTIRYATTDLASKKGKDKTVIITCAYDSNNNVYVLPIRAGHWTPTEKAEQIILSDREFTQHRFGIENASMQNDFFFTIDEMQKANNTNIKVEPISHGNINKNVRIANIETLFTAGKIYFCLEDPLTAELEAQLLAFDIEIEGSHDDLIDALAYQHHFIKERIFRNDNYIEDEEDTW